MLQGGLVLATAKLEGVRVGQGMEVERRQPVVRGWWPDLPILAQVMRNVFAHELSGVATQLAFDFTFSFFPTLLVLAVVLTTVDAPFLFARIMLALHTVLPPSAIVLVDQVLEEVNRGSDWRLFFAGLSLALWSAVSGLHTLICAINRAHGLCDDRPYWKRALLALALTLLLATLLVVATALVIGGRWLVVRLNSWLGQGYHLVELWVLLRWPVIFLSVMGGLLVLYAVAPKPPIRLWRALPGAVVGAAGWTAATAIFGWYINNFASYNRVYGSIGGMIVLMLWLYGTGLVVLIGAEINGVLYQRQFGREEC